jgi:tetratricopeptide (TPR) repeat protein
VAKSKRLENDPGFEIAFYENVLRHSPRFVEALVALAELYTKEGLYDKGLELDRRLAELRPDDPVIQYNLACSLSLKADVPAAFKAMKRAVENGYQDFAHLEKDQDLLNLWSDPGFQDYYREVKNPGKGA